jgi:hypothetical protein
MQNKELQVRALFEKMLEDTEEYARTYEHYVKDMKDYSAKVQWKLGPISGYQVFRGPEYSFKTDAEIEDPDVLIECDDLKDAKQFFRDGFEDMRDLVKADFEITSPRSADPALADSWRRTGCEATSCPSSSSWRTSARTLPTVCRGRPCSWIPIRKAPRPHCSTI